MDPVNAFGQSPYVAALANAIQIVSGIGALVAWYHISCARPMCFRHGRFEHGRKHYCAKHHPNGER